MLEHKRVHFLVVRCWRVRRPGGQQRAIGIAVAPKIGVQSSLVARERDALMRHEERAGHPGCVEQCHEIRQTVGCAHSTSTVRHRASGERPSGQA